MQLTPQAALLSGVVAAALADAHPAHLGVAVSGGGDSLALLHLSRQWAKDAGIGLAVVTVDHGLRPEAADEADFVSRVCAGLGVGHTVLRWRGWDGRGNLADAARRARYGLMADWAQARGIDVIALGHTADDQAETVLMRLARGSGVDGLCGMTALHRAHGLGWSRPMLTLRRAQLRDYLTGIGQAWVDDPSNDDGGYDRIKARRALAALAGLGVTVDGLNATGARMSLARNALQTHAQTAARAICTLDAGDVLMDRDGLLQQPQETRARLVAHALCWVASAEYRPRLSALTKTLEQVLAGQRRSLHGAILVPQNGVIRICREYQAVRATVCSPGALWDRRWRLFGPADNRLEVRALGEHGLRACPDWRETGRPRTSLLASPAVWHGGNLMAAPLAGMAGGWRAELAKPADSFFQTIESH